MALDTWINYDGTHFRNFRTSGSGGDTDPDPVEEPWSLYRTYNLTTDEGWTHTTGVRTTDAAYNRSQQTTFASDGMRITAERAAEGATIYSSDAQGRFAPVPNMFAVEADIDLGGYDPVNDHLGMGCFPAMWLRPSTGLKGEIDVWEYIGNYANISSPEMKFTLIKVGSSPYNQGSREFAIPKNKMTGNDFRGTHTWRMEKKPGRCDLWVDGNYVGGITQAQFDSYTSAGSYVDQFENGTPWYLRLTYQFGPAPGGNWNAGGSVPSVWRKSVMHISRMQVWEYTGN